jgi:hypothetical protein
VTDRSLDLDERMGFIVAEPRVRLAIGAEVHIVADSTLVTGTADVARVSLFGT